MVHALVETGKLALDYVVLTALACFKDITLRQPGLEGKSLVLHSLGTTLNVTRRAAQTERASVGTCQRRHTNIGIRADNRAISQGREIFETGLDLTSAPPAIPTMS